MEEKNYKIANKASLESDDMILKILARLPARSIARFKSVCKQWHRLISDPCFSRRYEARNHSLLGFFYGVGNRIKFSPVFPQLLNTGSFEFLPRPPRQFVRLVDSSNGLLLYYCFKGGLDEAEKLYILGNPVTGEEFALPLPPLQSDYLYASFFTHGFAFDHSSNPPHLIVTELIDGKEGLLVNTFSSYTCNWRSSEHDLVPLLGENFTLTGHSTYLNAAFHCLSQSAIVAYNIKSEHFSLITPPESMDRRYYSGILQDSILQLPYIYLGQSLERLLYIRVSAHSELSLWTLEDYYCGNWCHKYRIDIGGSLLGLLLPWPVVAFDSHDDVVYLNLRWKIFPCHLKNFKLKQLEIILDYPDNLKFRSPPCSYGLPRSPPSIPPNCYFSLLFPTVFNHQTVLGTHNTFGQSEDWFSTYTLSKRLNFDGASSLPIYPQRPREKDCAHYMRTRTCKFGDRCKFNHPLWVPGGGIQHKKKLGLGSTIYPQQSRLKCDFYMKTGNCKFGERCMFLHPIDRSAPAMSLTELALQQNVKLTLDGLPLRKGAICTWYLKNQRCQNGGIKCRLDHRPPDEIITMVTMQGTSTSVDGEVEERG